MQAIGEVELYLTQRPKEYQVFLDDSMFRNAIERQIGIIGEAMTKVLQIMPDIPITDARKIKEHEIISFMRMILFNPLPFGESSLIIFRN